MVTPAFTDLQNHFVVSHLDAMRTQTLSETLPQLRVIEVCVAPELGVVAVAELGKRQM
jgi:hypothetical protein